MSLLSAGSILLDSTVPVFYYSEGRRGSVERYRGALITPYINLPPL
jgi:hypothetical protein